MTDFRIEAHRIIDITRADEYEALSDSDKEWYKIFMSAGVINLETGSIAQDKLWDMFEAESQTGTELRDEDNRFVLVPAEEE